MANDRKRSLFSSLFSRENRKNQEAEEAAELEARQKLERRIEQALADMSVRLPDASDEERDAA